MAKIDISKEIDKLINTVNSRARVPRGFQFWSDKMILMWLRQNQKKETRK